MTPKSPYLRGSFDTLTALIYVLCVCWGVLNIFAAIHQPDSVTPFFDLSLNATKQVLWIGVSLIIITVIMVIDYRTFEVAAYFVYLGAVVLLFGVLVFGSVTNNSKSWFQIGFVKIQPAEFAKLAVALALAKYLSGINIKMTNRLQLVIAEAIIWFPAGLILLQGDLGSAMVFASFALVLYREGMPHWLFFGRLILVLLFVLALIFEPIYITIGILILLLAAILLITYYFEDKIAPFTIAALVALSSIFFVFSVEYVVQNVLKGYHRDRIMVLLDPENDAARLSAAWNVNQSKIAIGSGGIWGKGFLKGTQTKFNFVPEQSTDFIFCTVGEEYGWLGSLMTVGLFMTLLYRVVMIAERQRDTFGRVYGYGVASILFFHFTINISMTIGLFPVVGIPLPFFSYGGSSLIAFSILLFILLKLDAHRVQMFKRT
ncbi:rod shape-determining protein RodA [Eisenibacter elegans]|jgi:rod shape determining protein RodA|uniref:rod shape-determining protein RodA n=1 Tax=Eisenibacter elegans TaxID=997 RepID=UPI000409591C|nr:rod shape-determining protein RodA [Eisenibacter elegans]